MGLCQSFEVGVGLELTSGVEFGEYKWVIHGVGKEGNYVQVKDNNLHDFIAEITLIHLIKRYIHFNKEYFLSLRSVRRGWRVIV